MARHFLNDEKSDAAISQSGRRRFASPKHSAMLTTNYARFGGSGLPRITTVIIIEQLRACSAFSLCGSSERNAR